MKNTINFKKLNFLINSKISGGILIPTKANTNNFAQDFSYHKPIASIAVTKAYMAATIALRSWFLFKT